MGVGSRTDGRLYCHGCYDSASPIAVGAGPTCSFQEMAGHFSQSFSEEGLLQCGGAVSKQSVKRASGRARSGDARVETPQTDGDSVQTGSHKSVPSLSCDLWRQIRILVKFTFDCLSVALSAPQNLETGLSFSSIWLNTFVTF